MATETWPSIFHSIYLAAQFSHVLDYYTDDEDDYNDDAYKMI